MNDKEAATPQLNRKELKDLRVLTRFTEVYCRCHHHPAVDSHGDAESAGIGRFGGRYSLCGECRAFLTYAINRRLYCPLDPKPTCKHCQVHCYRLGHRERVREIMRFSGRRLLLRGRLDLLWHYFF